MSAYLLAISYVAINRKKLVTFEFHNYNLLKHIAYTVACHLPHCLTSFDFFQLGSGTFFSLIAFFVLLVASSKNLLSNIQLAGIISIKIELQIAEVDYTTWAEQQNQTCRDLKATA